MSNDSALSSVRSSLGSRRDYGKVSLHHSGMLDENPSAVNEEQTPVLPSCPVIYVRALSKSTTTAAAAGLCNDENISMDRPDADEVVVANTNTTDMPAYGTQHHHRRSPLHSNDSTAQRQNMNANLHCIHPVESTTEDTSIAVNTSSSPTHSSSSASDSRLLGTPRAKGSLLSSSGGVMTGMEICDSGKDKNRDKVEGEDTTMCVYHHPQKQQHQAQLHAHAREATAAVVTKQELLYRALRRKNKLAARVHVSLSFPQQQCQGEEGKVSDSINDNGGSDRGSPVRWKDRYQSHADGMCPTSSPSSSRLLSSPPSPSPQEVARRGLLGVCVDDDDSTPLHAPERTSQHIQQYLHLIGSMNENSGVNDSNRSESGTMCGAIKTSFASPPSPQMLLHTQTRTLEHGEKEDEEWERGEAGEGRGGGVPVGIVTETHDEHMNSDGINKSEMGDATLRPSRSSTAAELAGANTGSRAPHPLPSFHYGVECYHYHHRHYHDHHFSTTHSSKDSKDNDSAEAENIEENHKASTTWYSSQDTSTKQYPFASSTLDDASQHRAVSYLIPQPPSGSTMEACAHAASSAAASTSAPLFTHDSSPSRLLDHQGQTPPPSPPPPPCKHRAEELNVSLLAPFLSLIDSYTAAHSPIQATTAATGTGTTISTSLLITSPTVIPAMESRGRVQASNSNHYNFRSRRNSLHSCTGSIGGCASEAGAGAGATAYRNTTAGFSPNGTPTTRGGGGGGYGPLSYSLPYQHPRIQSRDCLGSSCSISPQVRSPSLRSVSILSGFSGIPTGGFGPPEFISFHGGGGGGAAQGMSETAATAAAAAVLAPDVSSEGSRTASPSVAAAEMMATHTRSGPFATAAWPDGSGSIQTDYSLYSPLCTPNQSYHGASATAATAFATSRVTAREGGDGTNNNNNNALFAASGTLPHRSSFFAPYSGSYHGRVSSGSYMNPGSAGGMLTRASTTSSMGAFMVCSNSTMPIGKHGQPLVLQVPSPPPDSDNVGTVGDDPAAAGAGGCCCGGGGGRLDGDESFYPTSGTSTSGSSYYSSFYCTRVEADDVARTETKLKSRSEHHEERVHYSTAHGEQQQQDCVNGSRSYSASSRKRRRRTSGCRNVFVDAWSSQGQQQELTQKESIATVASTAVPAPSVRSSGGSSSSNSGSPRNLSRSNRCPFQGDGGQPTQLQLQQQQKQQQQQLTNWHRRYASAHMYSTDTTSGMRVKRYRYCRCQHHHRRRRDPNDGGISSTCQRQDRRHVGSVEGTCDARGHCLHDSRSYDDDYDEGVLLPQGAVRSQPSQDSLSLGSMLYYDDVDSDALVQVEHKLRLLLDVPSQKTRRTQRHSHTHRCELKRRRRRGDVSQAHGGLIDCYGKLVRSPPVLYHSMEEVQQAYASSGGVVKRDLDMLFLVLPPSWGCRRSGGFRLEQYFVPRDELLLDDRSSTESSTYSLEEGEEQGEDSYNHESEADVSEVNFPSLEASSMMSVDGCRQGIQMQRCLRGISSVITDEALMAASGNDESFAAATGSVGDGGSGAQCDVDVDAYEVYSWCSCSFCRESHDTPPSTCGSGGTTATTAAVAPAFSRATTTVATSTITNTSTSEAQLLGEKENAAEEEREAADECNCMCRWCTQFRSASSAAAARGSTSVAFPRPSTSVPIPPPCTPAVTPPSSLVSSSRNATIITAKAAAAAAVGKGEAAASKVQNSSLSVQTSTSQHAPRDRVLVHRQHSPPSYHHLSHRMEKNASCNGDTGRRHRRHRRRHRVQQSHMTPARKYDIVCVMVNGSPMYIDPRTATGAAKVLADAALFAQAFTTMDDSSEDYAEKKKKKKKAAAAARRAMQTQEQERKKEVKSNMKKKDSGEEEEEKEAEEGRVGLGVATRQQGVTKGGVPVHHRNGVPVASPRHRGGGVEGLVTRRGERTADCVENSREGRGSKGLASARIAGGKTSDKENENGSFLCEVRSPALQHQHQHHQQQRQQPVTSPSSLPMVSSSSRMDSHTSHTRSSSPSISMRGIPPHAGGPIPAPPDLHVHYHQLETKHTQQVSRYPVISQSCNSSNEQSYHSGIEHNGSHRHNSISISNHNNNNNNCGNFSPVSRNVIVKKVIAEQQRRNDAGGPPVHDSICLRRGIDAGAATVCPCGHKHDFHCHHSEQWGRLQPAEAHDGSIAGDERGPRLGQREELSAEKTDPVTAAAAASCASVRSLHSERKWLYSSSDMNGIDAPRVARSSFRALSGSVMVKQGDSTALKSERSNGNGVTEVASQHVPVLRPSSAFHSTGYSFSTMNSPSAAAHALSQSSQPAAVPRCQESLMSTSRLGEGVSTSSTAPSPLLSGDLSFFHLASFLQRGGGDVGEDDGGGALSSPQQ